MRHIAPFNILRLPSLEEKNNAMQRKISNSFKLLTLVAAVALLVAACDSNGDDDDNGGIPGDMGFTAEVSGALDLSLSGSAGFGVGTNTATGAQGFSLGMTSTSGNGAGAVVSIGSAGAGRPDEGTYSFVDFDGTSDFEGQIIGTFQFNSETYLSDSGTLTITDSESNRLQARFTMTASTSGLPPAQTITITGEFDAPGTEVISRQAR